MDDFFDVFLRPVPPQIENHGQEQVCSPADDLAEIHAVHSHGGNHDEGSHGTDYASEKADDKYGTDAAQTPQIGVQDMIRHLNDEEGHEDFYVSDGVVQGHSFKSRREEDGRDGLCQEEECDHDRCEDADV